MESGYHYGQQLSTIYLFPVLTERQLHIVFIGAVGLCLLYGSWLYASRFLYDGHYQNIQVRQLVRPGDITVPYEGELSQTLTRSGHWTIHRLARLKKNLLATGITPKFLIGKAGWLFLQEEDGRKVVQQSLGVYQYPAAELKDWVLNIRQRHFWATRYGMDYILVIAPNKATIYPEYLPDRFYPLDQMSSREQLARAIPEISIIDLTDSIRQKKQLGQLYYKTDTHWNALGGFFGYRSLMQALSAPYSAAPLSRTAIRLKETKVRSGDLGRIMLDETNAQETIEYWGPNSPLARAEKMDAQSDGQPVRIRVYQQPDSTLPKVLFDHDSYLLDFEPFYAEHFSESIFLWGFQDFHADLIRRQQPDLIIDEFVERSLIGAAPRHEWPLLQEYWTAHFTDLPIYAHLQELTFEELIPELKRLNFPADKLPVLKITTQPEGTDKLVIDYGSEQGYYWLRAEGDVYYLEYRSQQVHNFRVEQQTPHKLNVEIRLY